MTQKQSMKVKELIAKLQQFDGDIDVVFFTSESYIEELGGGFTEHRSIDQALEIDEIEVCSSGSDAYLGYYNVTPYVRIDLKEV